MMRSISQPYCEICREALILNLYNVVSPIERFEPAAARLACAPGAALTLWVEPLQIVGTFETLWEVDDELLEDAAGTKLVLYPSRMTQGEHTVSAWIGDATDMVKNDAQGLLTGSHAWQVTKGFCSGRLSGKITDAKTGKPVLHALVSLADTAFSQRSDINGLYDLPDTACADYAVVVEAEGFKIMRAAASISDAEHVTLDVTLEPDAGVYYISGSISGEEVAAAITLAGESSVITTTAANRQFVLGPVSPGDYLVQVSAPGHLFLPAVQPVTVYDSDIEGVDFAARPTGSQMRIAGVVQGDTKRNVIITATGEQKAATVTDAEGNFTFENLPAGSYVLKPVHPGVFFEPAEQSVVLMPAQAAAILFWAREAPCAASTLLAGREADLQLLRQLRDTRLKENTRGQFYVDAYYLVSPEISSLLQRSPKIRQEALRVYEQCRPVLQMVLQGNGSAVPAATLAELKNFASHVSQHASPMLQKLVAHFIKDLEQGSWPAN